MGLENAFRDFIAKLGGAPHLAADIIRHLRIEDISTLLKSDQIFRTLFRLAIEQDSKLRNKVNEGATAMDCLKGGWAKLVLGTIPQSEFKNSNIYDSKTCECLASNHRSGQSVTMRTRQK